MSYQWFYLSIWNCASKHAWLKQSTWPEAKWLAGSPPRPLRVPLETTRGSWWPGVTTAPFCRRLITPHEQTDCPVILLHRLILMYARVSLSSCPLYPIWNVVPLPCFFAFLWKFELCLIKWHGRPRNSDNQLEIFSPQSEVFTLTRKRERERENSQCYIVFL